MKSVQPHPDKNQQAIFKTYGNIHHAQITALWLDNKPEESENDYCPGQLLFPSVSW
jgi:hypothetical protein